MIRVPLILLILQAVVIISLVACTPVVMGKPARQARPSQANAGEHVYDAAIVIAWNERVLTVAEAEDHFLTLKGVRTAAMMHVAMHDALNSIRPKYAPYIYRADESDASPLAAAAQAAYEVAARQYPKQKTVWTNELKKWLDTEQDGARKTKGIALGRAAAKAILKRRESDNWNAEAKYQWHPMAPGVYAEFNEHSGTPRGFIFGAGWSKMKPFMLAQADQFRAPPPPPINGRRYTVAFNEVKEVGRYASASRTPDQTLLAMWWKEFIESSHNRLARAIATREGSDLWDSARLFALLNMSITDAYISVFDSKFFYNHWRPYTAIRWAAHDGNPDTVADPQWNNTHRHTYAFPSYPSAHGTAGAAAMTILGKTFGDRYKFTMSTPEVEQAGPLSPKVRMVPPTRSFTSFSAAAHECALSRVYLGIHFRYDSEQGEQLGEKVGTYGWDHYLQSIE
jgi:membrane-associated phospholipid phosphatase